MYGVDVFMVHWCPLFPFSRTLITENEKKRICNPQTLYFGLLLIRLKPKKSELSIRKLYMKRIKALYYNQSNSSHFLYSRHSCQVEKFAKIKCQDSIDPMFSFSFQVHTVPLKCSEASMGINEVSGWKQAQFFTC